MAQRVGVIVNPVAGLGGRVGLKGTDGADIQRRALALGAQPAAGERAAAALAALAGLPGLEVLTYPSAMGADAARAAGLVPTVIGTSGPGPTTAEDTRRAAREMQQAGVALLLFAGGDGTARDICAAVGTALPVLGIPAGVKIHSAAYAASPRSAGELAALFLQGRVARLHEAEVLDVDEEAFRRGEVVAQLYGTLRVPYRSELVPGAKVGSRLAEPAALRAIARAVIARMVPEAAYIVGPGTTTRAVLEQMGLAKTLLGVDVVAGGRVVAADAGEAQVLAAMAGRPARIIVTPIGGQGYLFGRGNQPISPRVLREVGPGNVLVVCTPEKLQGLGGRPLRMDCGEEAVDRLFAGHVRVITGYGEEAVYRVGQ